ncbi:hypothetical protein Tco_0666441 [Tanacetum coccineum]
MDKLEKKLNEAEFNEEITMVVFKVFNNQFQQFITQHISMDYDQMANKFFTEYTLCDAQTFKDILIHQMDSVEKVIVERGLYKRAHDSRINKRMTQMKKGMVNMVKDKCDDGKDDSSSSSIVENNISELENESEECWQSLSIPKAFRWLRLSPKKL